MDACFQGDDVIEAEKMPRVATEYWEVELLFTQS